MGENEAADNNEKNAKRGEVIAARAALLDYYGDSALSFSNQFIASIFGLVASSAIIQSVLVFLLSKDIPLIIESEVFLFPSLLLFGGFSYMVNYTFNKFCYYSSLTSNLVTGKGGIYRKARLDELFVAYEEKVFLRDKDELEEARKRLIESKQLAENAEWVLKKKDGYHVNHLVNSTCNYFKYEKTRWRRHFKGLMILRLRLQEKN
jgi:hypothetical protein